MANLHPETRNEIDTRTGLPEDVEYLSIETQLIEPADAEAVATSALEEEDAIVRREIVEDTPDARYRLVDEVVLRKHEGKWKILAAARVEIVNIG